MMFTVDTDMPLHGVKPISELKDTFNGGTIKVIGMILGISRTRPYKPKDNGRPYTIHVIDFSIPKMKQNGYFEGRDFNRRELLNKTFDIIMFENNFDILNEIILKEYDINLKDKVRYYKLDKKYEYLYEDQWDIYEAKDVYLKLGILDDEDIIKRRDKKYFLLEDKHIWICVGVNEHNYNGICELRSYNQMRVLKNDMLQSSMIDNGLKWLWDSFYKFYGKTDVFEDIFYDEDYSKIVKNYRNSLPSKKRLIEEDEGRKERMKRKTSESSIIREVDRKEKRKRFLDSNYSLIRELDSDNIYEEGEEGEEGEGRVKYEPRFIVVNKIRIIDGDLEGIDYAFLYKHELFLKRVRVLIVDEEGNEMMIYVMEGELCDFLKISIGEQEYFEKLNECIQKRIMCGFSEKEHSDEYFGMQNNLQQHQLLQLHLQQQAAQQSTQRYQQFNYNLQQDDNQILTSSIPSNYHSFNKDIYLNPQLSSLAQQQQQQQQSDDFFISPHSSFSSVSRDSLLNNNILHHTQSLNQNQNQNHNQFNQNLPLELQGGVNNIFNRRPSYAADLHSNQNTLSISSNQRNDLYDLKNKSLVNSRSSLDYNNNNNNNIIINGGNNNNSSDNNINNHIDTKSNINNNNINNNNSNNNNNTTTTTNNNNHFQQQQQQQQQPRLYSSPTPQSNTSSQSDHDSTYIALDDGLLLNKLTNTIITSPELKRQFNQCSIYFGDFDAAMQIINQLNTLLDLSTIERNLDSSVQLNVIQHRINKLLEFLLKQNEDLKSVHHIGNKNYSLILNKNGRLDLISLPKNSNLQLMPKDLIIIEGDRGKDLVMVLKPIIDFKFALFFNYLKKKLHLKSLEFGNDLSTSRKQNNHHQNNNNNNNNGQKSIINEDENFITLPNKQILRFAKPHELNQLILKYNDEIMAYRICLNYSASLNLDLIIKNVEFQFDKKKLIIYYYCLQRLDFRGLIKELFKIYKTRIWLCAILPLEKTFKPLLDYELEKRDIRIDNSITGSYNQNSNINKLKCSSSTEIISNSLDNQSHNQLYRSNSNVVNDKFPSSDQIYQFTEITEPIYFHCKVFSNLINMFQFEISNYEIFKDRYWFLDE
ncbi:Dual specificity tyrosine-phosphorylation-regulated kinase 1A [Pichia californica]|uniref:Dual specificity tyrosine-phosphorylation-regulated kinase 1A n=1 Tax=Pichia californica TaxID=460514 RepID=A0A9P6WKR6_9ASCO|nr:Dual specificity tyrosine-phosphorylation-regulated kinase 1A [[Candida] californica]